MPSIGEDIGKVLADVGTPIDVYKYTTEETTREYLDPDDGVTKGSPFGSEFFLKAALPYNTTAEEGDLIVYAETTAQEKFLTVILKESRFEGSTIVYDGIFYKTNVVAQIKRKEEIRNPTTYSLETDWNFVEGNNVSGEYALFVGGTENTTSVMPMEFIIQNDILYTSKHINLQVEDRCIIKTSRTDETSGEAYEIINVESYKLPGIHVCTLREDNRE